MVTLKKENCLIYKNKLQILEFYNVFYDLLECRNNKIEILFGNKSLSVKDTKLFNLMDVDAIIQSVKYEKGSILYEYVSLLLNTITIDRQNDILNAVQNAIDDVLVSDKNIIDYSIEDNILKIIGNILNVENLNKDYVFNINSFLGDIILKNENKLFIVFYDSSFIPIKLFDVQNVYYFDVSRDRDLKDYNINLSDGIDDFNFDVLINEIEKLWPVPFSNDKIVNILNRFYRIYNSDSKYYTENKEEIILNKVLNILYSNDRKIEYDSSIFDNNIKSFLTN